MKHRFLVLLAVISLAMGACGGIPATPQPDGDGNQGTRGKSQGITVDGTVFPRLPFPTPDNGIVSFPQPILLFFLLDSSGSVVGVGSGANCPAPNPAGSTPIHRKTLMYFIDILTKLDPALLSFLYIGIARFGSTYDKKFYNGNEINSKYSEIYDFVAKGGNNDSSSSFDEGLKKSLESIEEYAQKNLIGNKQIYLLTDGFREEINGLMVEKQLADYHQKGVGLHVGLICPQVADVGFWIEHNLDTWYDGPTQWLSSIFDTLRQTGHLPSQSGWANGPTIIPLQLPPYATLARVYYYEFQDDRFNYVNVNVNGIPVRSSSVYTTSVAPDEQCQMSPTTLSLDTNMDRGFWMVEYDLPSPPDIALDPMPLGKNSDPVSITAHLTIPHMPAGELTKRRNCFASLDLFLLESQSSSWESVNVNVAQITPCPDGGNGLCPENGGASLFRTWTWTPKYDSPQEIQIAASWSNVVSPVRQTQIRFFAKIDEQPDAVFIPDSSPKTMEISVRSNQDNNAPLEMRLLVDAQIDLAQMTEQVRKSYGKYGSVSCPSSDGMEEKDKYDIVQQDFPLEENFVVFSKQPLPESYKNLYKIRLYEYVFSICKFNAIEFIWKADQSLFASDSVWICEWDAANFKVLPCKPR